MDILYLTEHDKAADADADSSDSEELLRELEATLKRLQAALHTALMVTLRPPTPIALPDRRHQRAAGAAAAPRSCPIPQASRSGFKEARQWLINSIAALDIQDPGTRRRRFTQYLPHGSAHRGAEHRAVCQAMLQLLFEAAPGEVGALLARDAALLRRFFQSDPKRVPLWFGHFRCATVSWVW